MFFKILDFYSLRTIKWNKNNNNNIEKKKALVQIEVQYNKDVNSYKNIILI